MNTVYVLCFSSVVSGGPELLHQLCYHLRNDFSINSQMHYFDAVSDFVVPDDYKVYNNPVATKICDSSENVLIVTEHNAFLSILKQYSRIRIIVWFLSIDNYYLTKLTKTDFFLKRIVSRLMRLVNINCYFDYEVSSKLIQKYNLREDFAITNAHLVVSNSVRGMLFLENYEFSPIYLSEYLNDAFINQEDSLFNKEDIVVYNPNKGFSFTRKIINSLPDIKFIPISGLSRNGVVKLLSRAKVYIDFGYHPGKDRLPREAAIMKCCVITSTKGSAGNSEDVPIPEQYKFECKTAKMKYIVATIRECIGCYHEKIDDFIIYRSNIRDEKSRFLDDLGKLVKRLSLL